MKSLKKQRTQVNPDVSSSENGKKNLISQMGTRKSCQNQKEIPCVKLPKKVSQMTKKNWRERFIKCSFPGIFENRTEKKLKSRTKDETLKTRDTVLKNKIIDLVEHISKAMNKGLLIFNRLLLYWFEEKKELPYEIKFDQTLFRQCLNAGTEKEINLKTEREESTNKRDISHVLETYFPQFKNTRENISGCSTGLDYASKQYRTNFLNSLNVNF